MNEYICMIKLKVKGGKIILFSTYAPPQTIKHPVNERQQFFNELAQFFGCQYHAMNQKLLLEISIPVCTVVWQMSNDS